MQDDELLTATHMPLQTLGAQYNMATQYAQLALEALKDVETQILNHPDVQAIAQAKGKPEDINIIKRHCFALWGKIATTFEPMPMPMPSKAPGQAHSNS